MSMTTHRAVRTTVRTPTRWGRVVATVVALVVVGIVGVSVYVGWNLSHAEPRPVDSDPSQVGLAYENIEFFSAEDMVRLRGWFLPAGTPSDATIIMAHGFRSNRLQPSVPALDLAGSLVQGGFNVLMFDFRNSGQSDGTVTTLGYHEVKDILGAIAWLQEQYPGIDKVGLMGFSMGAVTSALAAAREPAVGAVVLDSPFADLRPYLQQNMPFWTGLPDVPFTWTIMAILPPLIGLDMAAVSPVQVMPQLTQPALIIHTADDEAIPASNSEQLAAAGNPDRTELWIVPGSKHVGARETSPTTYDERVLRFFRSSL